METRTAQGLLRSSTKRLMQLLRARATLRIAVLWAAELFLLSFLDCFLCVYPSEWASLKRKLREQQRKHDQCDDTPLTGTLHEATDERNVSRIHTDDA